MQRLIISLLLLTGLGGCAQHSGNYANVSGALNATMADDAVDELNRLYPPASTHLLLLQAPQDAYGAELVRALRENGYAIEDHGGFSGLFASPATAGSGSNADQHNTKDAKTPAPAEKAESASKPISYIVDHMGEGLYRVTITIDSTILSRVYTSSGKSISPAGAWTRKE